MKNHFHFDGTMLISAGEIILKDKKSFPVLTFQQTNKKRIPNMEYPTIKIDPELYFFFYSKNSINALIRACEKLKENFEET